MTDDDLFEIARALLWACLWCSAALTAAGITAALWWAVR